MRCTSCLCPLREPGNMHAALWRWKRVADEGFLLASEGTATLWPYDSHPTFAWMGTDLDGQHIDLCTPMFDIANYGDRDG